MLDINPAQFRSPQSAVRILTQPGPGITKPDCRQNADRRSLVGAIGHCDPDQDVLDIGFGVLDKNVKVLVLIKNAGVQQLEFAFVLPSSAILNDQSFIWKS